MLRKYKYDIAISVAEEDLPVAKEIASALRKHKIKYYLYSEHIAENFGKPLLKVTLDAYGISSKYVLMITSKIFAQKYWAGIENQTSQVFAKSREVYILQLRLDDTLVDGLSKQTVYVNWKKNPDDIALLIAQKLYLKRIAERKKKARTIVKTGIWFLVAAVFIAITSSLFIASNYSRPGLLRLPSTDSTPELKPGSETKKSHDTQPPVRSLQKTETVVNNTTRKPSPENDSGRKEKHQTLHNTPRGCCFDITGNSASLVATCRQMMAGLIISNKYIIAADCFKAEKTITVSILEQSTKSETSADIICTTCSYKITITNKSGIIIGSDAGRLVKPGFDKEANFTFIAQQLVNKITRIL